MRHVAYKRCECGRFFFVPLDDRSIPLPGLHADPEGDFVVTTEGKLFCDCDPFRMSTARSTAGCSRVDAEAPLTSGSRSGTLG